MLVLCMPLQLKELLDTKFRTLEDFRAAQPEADRIRHQQVQNFKG